MSACWRAAALSLEGTEYSPNEILDWGPVIGGKCAFEKAFEDALPDRRVKFVDDWYSYHEMSGEVHCGTNALREPFAVSRWWSVRPEGGFDIKALRV